MIIFYDVSLFPYDPPAAEVCLLAPGCQCHLQRFKEYKYSIIYQCLWRILKSPLKTRDKALLSSWLKFYRGRKNYLFFSFSQ